MTYYCGNLDCAGHLTPYEKCTGDPGQADPLRHLTKQSPLPDPRAFNPTPLRSRSGGPVVGYRHHAGWITDVVGNAIGQADPSGTVKDTEGNTVGQIRPDGTLGSPSRSEAASPPSK